MNSRFSWVLALLLLASVSLNLYLFTRLTLDDVLAVIPPSPNLPQRQVQVPDHQAKVADVVVSTVNQDQAQVTAKQANEFFDRLLFAEAVSLYEELALLDEQAAIELKRRWYEQAKNWLDGKDYNTIDQFNDTFLMRFPYDLTFLGLKADTLAATDRVADAIELYFSLISYTFETRQEEYFQTRIHQLAGDQLGQYKQNQLWQAIIDLTQQLLLQEADYPPYLLAQAEAYIKIEAFDNAESLLQSLLGNQYYHEPARQLLNQINQEQLQQTAIKLRPLGEHYLVDGRINQTSDISLMIDTGASISVLTQDRFDEIQSWTNPIYMGETLLNTAGGQVNAPIYQFERFQIDYFFVNNISFVVLDLPDMVHYHGLLGMNFLKQFKFQMDQKNNLLILSP